MDSKSTSGISKAWKAALLTAAFGGLLLFGGTASARAENCSRNLYKQEQKVNDAVNRHGYNSRQANHERYKLGEVQQKCGYQNYGYSRDGFYNRAPYNHRDPYYGRHPYGNYGRNQDYRRDRNYDPNEDYGYRRDRQDYYHRNDDYDDRRNGNDDRNEDYNRDRHRNYKRNRENQNHDHDEH
ncbi:MAG TPA: hypothetical protein VOA41_20660 [Candidatus Dormibacteraeota bacterium]|nr:hypothetical protein [Candidatus Dormibacteraeota bacterium]